MEPSVSEVEQIAVSLPLAPDRRRTALLSNTNLLLGAGHFISDGTVNSPWIAA
jgi:hypothetical protein